MGDARDQMRATPGGGVPDGRSVAPTSLQRPRELVDLNAEISAQIEQTIGIEEFRATTSSGVVNVATLASEAFGHTDYFASETQPEIQAIHSAWGAIEKLHDRQQSRPARSGKVAFIRIAAVAELLSFPALYAGLPWLFEALSHRVPISSELLLLCVLEISITWLQSLGIQQLARAAGVADPPKQSFNFVMLLVTAASVAVVLIPLAYWLRAGRPYTFDLPAEVASAAFGVLALGYLYMRLAFWSTYPRMLRVYIHPRVRRSMRQIGAASPWELTVGATTGTLLASIGALYRAKAPAGGSEDELRIALDGAVERWREAIRERAILPYLRARVDEIISAEPNRAQREASGMLTPRDIRNKQFSTTRLRPGYDEEEVDAFLDEVEAEITRLMEENKELRSRLAEVMRGGRNAGSPALTSPLTARTPAVSDDVTDRFQGEDYQAAVTREIPEWPYGPLQRARDSVVSEPGRVADDRGVIIEEDVVHADGVLQRFKFGSGSIVLIDRTPESDTINWSSLLTPRSFLNIAQELLRSRDNVQAEVSIDGRIAEMSGDFLFGLAESMSDRFDATCEFIRFDTQESCVAFQILPSKATASQERFIGVSARKIDAATFIPVLLRTASPLIVEQALGLSGDSFMARVGVLLGGRADRVGGD